MLAYILALVVGLSSFALYMAAFFFPEVHRKHDFLWSGLGLFYALVLWVCAGRITGGVLLGQTASVALLGWLGWQTLTLRRQVAPVDQQTAVPTPAEWQAALSQAWAKLSRSKSIAPVAQPIGKQVAKLVAWLEALVTTTTTPTKVPPTDVEPPYVPLTPADFANARQESIPPSKTTVADAPSVQTSGNAQPQENPLTAIAKQAQNAFKGLNTKRESKPVYVRKQFRAPEKTEAQAAIDVVSAKTSSDAVPAPTSSEPSASDAIEATVMNAEAEGVSTSLSGTIEAKPVSEPEPLP